jgi:tetratricopeptide (TPR) repeat protein
LDLVYILLLLVLGLIAYANSFFASFYLDDYSHILRNDAIYDLINFKRIYAHSPERFLTYLTLAFNYNIGGHNPLSYHLFNFFIHFTAAIFLYLLSREIWNTPALRATPMNLPESKAFFAVAAIFFLHPLQTESVTYVIQRAESMAGMFYLAALYFYVRARLEKKTGAILRYGALTGLSALGAAFSKETAVTLPVMIGLFELFLFETSIKELLRNKIFLFLLVPASLVVFYKIGPLLQKDFYYDPEIPFTRKEYLLTQFSVVVTYLRLFFYPVGQNIDWDFPIATSFFATETIFSFLVLLALLAISLAAHRRFRLVSLGILGFFLTLAPTSSIIPIKDVIFEHRMYLAVAFLAMGCVQLLSHGLGKLQRASRQAYKVWKDAVEKSPNKARPHNNYGRALYQLGGKAIPQARKEIEIANRLDPDWAMPWHNLAVISFNEGDYEQAVYFDLQALEKKQNYLAALYQLAKSYKELGQYQPAQQYLEQLLKVPPKSGLLPSYLDLIELYLKTGQRSKALELAGKLDQLPHVFPGVDYYRGLAWYRLEDFHRAEFYFSRQTTQRSKRIASFLMLGQIHYLREESEKAETALRQVLVEQPWSPTAHYNLSVILEGSNRLAEAREHLEILLGIQTFSLAPRIRLIRLYDQLGEYGLRSETIRLLLGLRPDSVEFSFLKANEDRDLDVTLHSYSERFLTGSAGNSPSRREKTSAIIATLRGDLAGAIESYENYVLQLDESKEVEKIEKEIQRLETVLGEGREPMEVPA